MEENESINGYSIGVPLQEKNIVYTAPTSAGKSLVAELLAITVLLVIDRGLLYDIVYSRRDDEFSSSYRISLLHARNMPIYRLEYCN